MQVTTTINEYRKIIKQRTNKNSLIPQCTFKKKFKLVRRKPFADLISLRDEGRIQAQGPTKEND